MISFVCFRPSACPFRRTSGPRSPVLSTGTDPRYAKPFVPVSRRDVRSGAGYRAGDFSGGGLGATDGTIALLCESATDDERSATIQHFDGVGANLRLPRTEESRRARR